MIDHAALGARFSEYDCAGRAFGEKWLRYLALREELRADLAALDALRMKLESGAEVISLASERHRRGRPRGPEAARGGAAANESA